MRSGADDVRMTCRRCADDVCMCGRCADDVRTTYVIRQLKSPTKSRSRVVCTSSARRPHVVRASSARRPPRDFNPEIFRVKEQRAALLKSKRSLCAFIDKHCTHYKNSQKYKEHQFTFSKWVILCRLWSPKLYFSS